jgi:hypothetical protein
MRVSLAKTSIHLLAISVCLAALTLFAAGKAAASAGGLDRSFASHGTRNITDALPGSVTERAVQAIALAKDGSQFIVIRDNETCAAGPCSSLFVSKLGPSGALDPGFSPSPMPTTPAPFTEVGEAKPILALDSAGGIYVAGALGSALNVTHLAADGSRDPAFGIDGTASAAIGRAVVARALLVKPGGAILLAGTISKNAPGEPAREPGMVLAQFQANGLPDPSFAGGAPSSQLIGPHRQVSNLLGLRGGLLAGTSAPGEVLRLSQEGALKGSAPQLILKRDWGPGAAISALIARGRGLLAIGTTWKGTFVEALGPDLGLNRHFGSAGTSFLPGFRVNPAHNAILDRRGRLLLAGSVPVKPQDGASGEASGIGVLRLTRNGHLDRSFADGRQHPRLVSEDSRAIGIGLEPGNRILVLVDRGYVCFRECPSRDSYVLERLWEK